MNIEFDRFYTICEVAQILRMSEKVVRRLCREGQIVAVGSARTGYRVMGECLINFGRGLTFVNAPELRKSSIFLEKNQK